MVLRKPKSNIDLDEVIQECDDAQLPTNSWRHYHCKLVTPMYGGGIKAGEVDTKMPIRAASIRGHLRFWWRIAYGPFSSSEEMFKREAAIWGGIGYDGPKASKVDISVFLPAIDAAKLASSEAEGHPAIKYAFGPATINGAVDWLMPGYEFQLRLRIPSDDEIAGQILEALRWWACFGGVGARTRRGFGAIHLRELTPLSSNAVSTLGARLEFAGSGSGNAESEWKTAIDRLYAFRQKAGTGRKTGNPRPGRSYWPEPDQIRRFTNRNANGKHSPEHESGNVFPRAAFGLPITFEFRGSPGDPPKLELHPAGDTDRMSSPLLLRPYWNGTKWQAAALLLPGWKDALTQPLKFKSQSYKPEHWPKDSSERIKKAASISPMKLPNGELRAEDPLSAFMDFFKKGL